MAIAEAIESRQATYLSDSRQITQSDVDAWPYHRRIWNNAVATVGPIL